MGYKSSSSIALMNALMHNKDMKQLKTMLIELADAKVTQSQIAERVSLLTDGSCSQATISRILNREGYDPSFSVGHAIKQIHTEQFQPS